MMLDQVEVYITVNGLGRAAIVRRSDGLFVIYTHWRWDDESLQAFKAIAPHPRTWFDDHTPLKELYVDVEPQSGVYGTLDDARKNIGCLAGFGEVRFVTS